MGRQGDGEKQVGKSAGGQIGRSGCQQKILAHQRFALQKFAIQNGGFFCSLEGEAPAEP